MKKNISFYPHMADADQHAKFKMLRVAYGWEGEGKFWALNNRIAQSENCCLDISKKYNKAATASDLDFNLEEFDNFIEFLKNDCELIFECSPGVVSTEIIQETFKKVMRDRGEARERYRRASAEKQETSAEVLYRIKESKGKESKGKESKGKESKGKKEKDLDEEAKSRCPQQKIIETYNRVAGDKLRKVIPSLWSDKRSDLLRKRWNEDKARQNVDWWEDYFASIVSTPFLSGDNDRCWRADIDWMLRKENMVKVLEGKYIDASKLKKDRFAGAK